MLDLGLVMLLLTGRPGTAPISVACPAEARLASRHQLALTQTRPVRRWPSAQDLARLRLAEGKSRVAVHLLLGPPSSVERRADGEETWEYPWLASCSVWFKNGRCTNTFYDAGY
ncbi:MAG TPA: hypothetical protein VKE74_32275 [Gemmataceae bacterium]|nr:hypothetical protein [Gemmataceae bacterium]